MARKQLTKAEQKAKRERIAKRIEKNRRETVDELVKLIEKKKFAWVHEWSLATAGYDVDLFAPYNPVTGTRYRGANLINLATHCIITGIADNRFTTANQAKKNGWTVRDDAVPFMVEKCKKFNYRKEDKDGNPVLDNDGNEIWYSYVRPVSYWYVYNYSQIDGAPELPKADRPDVNVPDDKTYEDVLMDRLKETSRCEIRERVGDRAYYSPGLDYINVPLREEFTCRQAALRTMLHEMAHSTGHQSALSRNQGGRFGTKDYAFEELIAELSSLFSASQLSVDLSDEDEDAHKKNHAAYLDFWIKKLKSDTAYLYRAATYASAATDYIVTRLASAYPEYARKDESDNDSTTAIVPVKPTPVVKAQPVAIVPAPVEPNGPVEIIPDKVEKTDDYDGMTVAQLKAECRRKKIRGYSGKTKAAMVELLRNPPKPKAAKPRTSWRERKAAEEAAIPTVDLLESFARRNPSAALLLGSLCDMRGGDGMLVACGAMQELAIQESDYALRTRMPEDIAKGVNEFVERHPDTDDTIMGYLLEQYVSSQRPVYDDLEATFGEAA